jgi:hypothetical protein
MMRRVMSYQGKEHTIIEIHISCTGSMQIFMNIGFQRDKYVLQCPYRISFICLTCSVMSHWTTQILNFCEAGSSHCMFLALTLYSMYITIWKHPWWPHFACLWSFHMSAQRHVTNHVSCKLFCVRVKPRSDVVGNKSISAHNCAQCC